jgi:hypothetical protein
MKTKDNVKHEYAKLLVRIDYVKVYHHFAGKLEKSK